MQKAYCSSTRRQSTKLGRLESIEEDLKEDGREELVIQVAGPRTAEDSLGRG